MALDLRAVARLAAHLDDIAAVREVLHEDLGSHFAAHHIVRAAHEVTELLVRVGKVGGIEGRR